MASRLARRAPATLLALLAPPVALGWVEVESAEAPAALETAAPPVSLGSVGLAAAQRHIAERAFRRPQRQSVFE